MKVPDSALAGAWLLTVDHGTRLTLLVTGVRRCGLLLAGDVVFEDARVTASDPRMQKPQLKGAGRIEAFSSSDGTAMLHIAYQSGPGDIRKSVFVIHHRRMRHRFSVAPVASLRNWLGFYPLARDIQR